MNLLRVRAPGRVNLIGEHTDYTGGLCLPMAIDRCTEIVGEEISGYVELASDDEEGSAAFSLPISDVGGVEPAWARYVAAVAAELGAHRGIRGTVSTTIPLGAGLSSSAALEVAMALALGMEAPPLEIAQLCQRAERRAMGVPTGILDQLSCAAGVAGHALIIDCHALTVTPTPMPDDLDVVVQFIAHRRLAGSEYTERVADCARAEALIGPLRLASISDLSIIDDATTRGRARHVITENARVVAFAAALAAGDARLAGQLMIEAHRSISEDFAASTPQMDGAVAEWCDRPGVFGARMTGGGFGGCVVALADKGAIAPLPHTWVVKPAAGAARIE
jgi:galactokinase